MSLKSIHDIFEMDSDTSSCFFCLQDCENTNNFSLRNVFRFQELFNHRSTPLNGLKISSSSSSSVVSICEDCSEITEEFATLFNLLEVTKLKVDYCIEKMRGIMSKADRKSRLRPLIRPLKFRSRQGRENESPEETLRKQTMRLLKGTIPLPVVLLTRLQSRSRSAKIVKKLGRAHPSLRNETPPNVKHETEIFASLREREEIDSMGIDSLPESELEGMDMDVDAEIKIEDSVSDYDHEEPPSLPKRRKIKRRKNLPQQLRSINTDPTNLNCSHCRATFQSRRSLDLHMIQYHCDHFFPRHKLNSVNDLQFRKIIAELLFKDLIDGKTKCSYCNKKIPAGKDLQNILFFKKHIIQNHYPEIEEKLLSIQKDPELSEILDGTNPREKFCDCGMYLKNSQALTSHKKSHCRTAIGEKRLTPDNPNLSLLAVEGQVENESGSLRETEEIDSMDNHNLPESEAEEIDMGADTDIKIEDDSDYEALPIVKKKIISRRRNLLRYKSINTSPTNLKCFHCRAAFQSRRSLDLHMIQYHCDHFFSMHKVDSVSDLQFRKIIAELLFKDLIDGKTECSYCNKKIPAGKDRQNIIYFKKHLIQSHYPEMEAKLLDIQRNPKLSKVLDRANPKGKFCEDCRMYLRNSQVLTFHKKFHCKIAKGKKRQPASTRILNPCNVKEESDSGSLKETEEIDSVNNHDLQESEVEEIEMGMGVDIDNEDDRGYEPPSPSLPRRVKMRKINKRKKFFPLKSINASPTNLNCSLCRAIFQSRRSLDLHMIQFHCDHFFPNQKLDSVSVFQYRKIVAELLFKDIVDGRKSCSYCDRKFRFKNVKDIQNVLYFKKHLILHHQSALEAKLLDIQRNPEFSEILESINPKGKFCDCGMYLPTGTNHAVGNHEKLHCKLANGKKKMPPWTRILAPDNPNSCPFCRAKYHNTNKYALRTHMTQYHCEHLFPNHKLESVTDLQFQKILVDLLFRDGIDSGGNRMKCPYCEKKTDSSWHLPTNHLNNHIISKHYEELEQKLMEIQRDPNLSTTLAIANPHGVVCECGVYLHSASSQATHDNLHCPKKTLMDEEKRKKWLFGRKKKGRKPKNDDDNDDDDDLMEKFESVPGNKKKITCKLCSIEMCRRYAYKHWTYSCVYGRRLVKEKKTEPKKRKSKYPASCPYCRYQTDCNSDRLHNNIKKHFARFHPQHYFLQPGEPGVETPDLLQRVLEDIIFPECWQTIGQSISCRLCESNFLGNVEARIHLVIHHKEELIKRFRGIVGEPNLEERLYNCNPNGWKCACGMYLPQGRNASKGQRSYHEKYQCKLLLSNSNYPSETVNIQGQAIQESTIMIVNQEVNEF